MKQKKNLKVRLEKYYCSDCDKILSETEYIFHGIEHNTSVEKLVFLRDVLENEE